MKFQTKPVYQALARKWRPQNFSELVGQEAARRTLANSLRQNRLYPVLLFTGPRGTGKTSTARILAKTIRCPHVKDLSPCGKCGDCLLIQEGKSLDVLEIDGASNNGVDAVRELRDTVSYMPSSGSRKIYIIDEAHMLSSSAFNALLKTLEEPPDHVIFIMATTEARKIPQTVMSRCQKLDFHLISPLLIKKQLEKISQTEKIPVEEEALWLIAKQAKGSLRDSQGLLDQMIAFCKGEVTEKKIIEILGLTDRNIIFRALAAIIQREESRMIEIIRDIRSAGSEASLALQDLIESLRDLMILKLNPENNPPLVQSSRQEIERLKKLGQGASYEDIHFLFDMALKGSRELALSQDSQMVLEVLLLRFSQAPRLEAIAAFSLAEKPLEEKPPEEKPPEEKPSPKKNGRPPAPSKSKVQKQDLSSGMAPLKAGPSPELSLDSSLKLSLENSASGSPAAPAKSEPSKPFLQTEAPQTKLKTETAAARPLRTRRAALNSMPGQWPEFMSFLRSKHPAEAGLMENLSLKSSSGGCFVFLVPETSFIKSKCERPETRRFLEEQLSAFFKSKKTVQFERRLSDAQPTIKEQKIAENQKNLLERAAAHPFVRDANAALKVRIKSVSRSDSLPVPSTNLAAN